MERDGEKLALDSKRSLLWKWRKVKNWIENIQKAKSSINCSNIIRLRPWLVNPLTYNDEFVLLSFFIHIKYCVCDILQYKYKSIKNIFVKFNKC